MGHSSVSNEGIANFANNVWADVRFALRSMRKHPLLAIAVTLTLTFGIGISTGVFTLIDAVALRAHVSKNRESFVRLFTSYTLNPTHPGRFGPTTYEDYEALRNSPHFRDLAA